MLSFDGDVQLAFHRSEPRGWLLSAHLASTRGPTALYKHRFRDEATAGSAVLLVFAGPSSASVGGRIASTP